MTQGDLRIGGFTRKQYIFTKDIHTIYLPVRHGEELCCGYKENT